MIDIYYWTSPNAQKVMLFLEESGHPFRIVPLNVTLGEQYQAEFVKIAPNSRIPVIVDDDPRGGGEPVVIFESGAILLYLAEKTNKFLSKDWRVRIATLQWVFWQVGGLGPIGGQCVHFKNYAPYPVDYAITRFETEHLRLIGVLDGQLADKDYICCDYSIADMACYPWIAAHVRRQQLDFGDFPNLARWYEQIRNRPATERAYAWISEISKGLYVKNHGELSVDARKILFGSHAV